MKQSSNRRSRRHERGRSQWRRLIRRARRRLLKGQRWAAFAEGRGVRPPGAPRLRRTPRRIRVGESWLTQRATHRRQRRQLMNSDLRAGRLSVHLAQQRARHHTIRRTSYTFQ